LDFFRAVIFNDEPKDFPPEFDHSLKEPGGRFAAMQRKVGNAGLAHG
jgi:hypothetical protein